VAVEVAGKLARIAIAKANAAILGEAVGRGDELLQVGISGGVSSRYASRFQVSRTLRTGQ
jgi:hypothetical protein